MPNSPNYTRRRVLTIAIATAAWPVTVLSLNAGGPADRRVVAESRFDVTSAPLQAEVVQLVVDFPSGAWTSWHTHGGAGDQSCARRRDHPAARRHGTSPSRRTS